MTDLNLFTLIPAVTAFVLFCAYVSGVRLSDFRGRK